MIPDRDEGPSLPAFVVGAALCVVWGTGLGIPLGVWDEVGATVHVAWVSWVVAVLASIWGAGSSRATAGGCVVVTVVLLVSALPVGFLLLGSITENDSRRETRGERTVLVRAGGIATPKGDPAGPVASDGGADGYVTYAARVPRAPTRVAGQFWVVGDREPWTLLANANLPIFEPASQRSGSPVRGDGAGRPTS